jgi:hypothetical protein
MFTSDDKTVNLRVIVIEDRVPRKWASSSFAQQIEKVLRQRVNVTGCSLRGTEAQAQD